MIPSADITNVRPQSLTETPPLSPVSALASTSAISQETQGNITQLAIGQLFQAQVLSQLQDGTFLVNVANNTFRMALPGGTTVGTTQQMTLLGIDPRPSFLLDPHTEGTSASLSSAAKVIDTILQTAQQTNASTSLVGKTPLVAPHAFTPTQLAVTLHDTIEFSGVFYESHLNQWVSGERDLPDLLREPQATASAGDVGQSSVESSGEKSPTNNEMTVIPRPATTGVELSNSIIKARQAADLAPSLKQVLHAILDGRDLPKDADTLLKSTAITPANAQNIHLQLNALEQHRLSWQGELWPGQKMEWEIEEKQHGDHQRGGNDDIQASWQSVVRFDFPSLGKISASIHLYGEHVQIKVSTELATSAATLQANGKELSDALSAAGSPLDALAITQDEQI